jgi:hypothetical protein
VRSVSLPLSRRIHCLPRSGRLQTSTDIDRNALDMLPAGASCCRLYPADGGRLRPAPPDGWIIDALPGELEGLRQQA